MTKKANKVSIEDILEKKQLVENTVNKPYYSNFFGGEIEIENHPVDKFIKITTGENAESFRGDIELIYNFCPIFRAKNLQEQLGVDDPYDVVEKAFCNNILEVKSLAFAIAKRYGFDLDEADKIKKP